MPRGAPAIKLAITVDHGVHEGVVRAANEENVSVSAWMTAAARRSLRVRDGLGAVAEWEAQHGTLTALELEQARSVVYDAGPLIAAGWNDRRLWAEHRARLELGIVPCVPTPVVAQVSRSGRQAQLRRLLRGCEVAPLDESEAHRVGALLGKSRTADVVDAAVVILAVARRADVVTSDRTDIERLFGAAGSRLRVVDT